VPGVADGMPPHVGLSGAEAAMLLHMGLSGTEAAMLLHMGVSGIEAAKPMHVRVSCAEAAMRLHMGVSAGEPAPVPPPTTAWCPSWRHDGAHGVVLPPQTCRAMTRSHEANTSVCRQLRMSHLCAERTTV
jgi:hypothetical protein